MTNVTVGVYGYNIVAPLTPILSHEATHSNFPKGTRVSEIYNDFVQNSESNRIADRSLSLPHLSSDH